MIRQLFPRRGRKRVAVSVLMLIRDPHDPGLALSLASLRMCSNPAWELCVAMASSAAPATAPGADPRVRIVQVPEETGPAAAYQVCFARASGRFVVLLEPGEEIDSGALKRAVRLLDGDPQVDVVYADEDRVTATGIHHTPFFRPGWSPDYLLGALYVDRALVVRGEAIKAVGAFRSEYDPAPQWDLVLRLSETGRPFAHLPQLLVHRPGEQGAAWRVSDPALITAGRRAVSDACHRRGMTADVLPQSLPGTYRVRGALQPFKLISVVVPFRDGAVLLKRCIGSVLATCGNVPLEIVLVNNGSTDEEIDRFLRSFDKTPHVRVVSAPGPFNFAALVNRGAAEARGDVLCLLNSDVEALAGGWLEELTWQAERPEIGAAGAKLLYPDGSIQHAGVVMGILGGTGHAHRFAPGDHPGYFANAAVVREVSAVTGACLAARRDVFESLGGFDESLPVTYNDVDFCLRLRERGYRVICTPYAVLLHHEGASRGRENPPPDAAAYMRRRWGVQCTEDPYYHPRLTRTEEDYTPAVWPLGGKPHHLFDWIHRQVARVRWVGEDVTAGLRGWKAVLGVTGGQAESATTITLVAGGPVAVHDRPNHYWIRLVNADDEPCEMSLDLLGCLRLYGTERRFRVVAAKTLGPGSAEDIACETDWKDRFELSDEVPSVGCTLTGGEAGSCEIIATVRRGQVIETARIVQQVNA